MSSEKPPDPHTAIQNTLKLVFGSSSQAQTTNSTRRTMLKRSDGRIMTENDVIEQLEEQRRKKDEKKPRRTYRKASGGQHQARTTNGMLN